MRCQIRRNRGCGGVGGEGLCELDGLIVRVGLVGGVAGVSLTVDGAVGTQRLDRRERCRQGPHRGRRRGERAISSFSGIETAVRGATGARYG